MKDAPGPSASQPQIHAVVETIGNKAIFCHIIKNSEKKDDFLWSFVCRAASCFVSACDAQAIARFARHPGPFGRPRLFSLIDTPTLTEMAEDTPDARDRCRSIVGATR
jgi:hypothetical protein